MIVELDYLQDIHAHYQCTGDSRNEQGAGHESLVDQACLFFVVLDRYRFGHLCSNSLKKNADPWAQTQSIKNELHHTKSVEPGLCDFFYN
ncbi:hypothetical protein D3C85_1702850 [compost metagenome]